MPKDEKIPKNTIGYKVKVIRGVNGERCVLKYVYPIDLLMGEAGERIMLFYREMLSFIEERLKKKLGNERFDLVGATVYFKCTGLDSGDGNSVSVLRELYFVMGGTREEYFKTTDHFSTDGYLENIKKQRKKRLITEQKIK